MSHLLLLAFPLVRPSVAFSPVNGSKLTRRKVAMRLRAEPARKAGCIWPRSERRQTRNEITSVVRDEQ